MPVVAMWRLLLATVVALVPLRAGSQELADYDYTNLSFRGVLAERGYIFANNVENTEILGIRFDLGFLGPGFRIVPGVAYWASHVAQSEVADFERKLTDLNTRHGGTSPPDGFDLGVIDREDVVVSLDGHYLWSVPANFLFWMGVGASAHFLNGSGSAVDETFVEDLLDSVSAGFNIHGGLEYPLIDRVRVYGGGKVEVLGDLRYAELRAGLTFVWGELAEGEGR